MKIKQQKIKKNEFRNIIIIMGKIQEISSNKLIQNKINTLFDESIINLKLV